MVSGKRGQLDFPILTFVVVVFGLLIFAPIMLKIFNEIKAPVSSALGNVSGGGSIAQANFNSVMDVAISFWDKVIVAAFIVALLFLFISAFLIDVHPFWVILYIFICFMLILFAPDIIGALDGIYSSAEFVGEVSQLSFMDGVRVHFAEFLVGIMVITGIIIYGKVAVFTRPAKRSRRGGRGR